jgi:uncharacterized protein YkwD
MKKLRALCLILVAMGLPSQLFAQSSLQTLKKRLRSNDPEIAFQALDDLLARGESGRKEAHEILTLLLSAKKKCLENSVKSMRALTKKLGDSEKREEIGRMISEHLDAGKKAIAFAFNDAEYPTTIGGTYTSGSFYQKGQIFIEGRTELAVRLFNLAEAEILKSLGGKVRRIHPGGLGIAEKLEGGTLEDDGQPLKMVTYNLLDGTKEWKKIAGKFSKKYMTYSQTKERFQLAVKLAAKAGLDTRNHSPESEPLPIAAGAVFAGDYEVALAERPEEKSIERLIFNLFVSRHILIRNQEAKMPLKPEEKGAMHEVNLYRVVLGLWPLNLNSKITAAAKEHSLWQEKNKKCTYSELVTDLDGPETRMKRHGYAHPGARGEYVLFAVTNSVLWPGRVSSSAHRRIINPKNRAGGVAICGVYLTINFGNTIENASLHKLVKQ